jgi:ribosomal protein L37E
MNFSMRGLSASQGRTASVPQHGLREIVLRQAEPGAPWIVVDGAAAGVLVTCDDTGVEVLENPLDATWCSRCGFSKHRSHAAFCTACGTPLHRHAERSDVALQTDMKRTVTPPPALVVPSAAGQPLPEMAKDIERLAILHTHEVAAVRREVDDHKERMALAEADNRRLREQLRTAESKIAALEQAAALRRTDDAHVGRAWQRLVADCNRLMTNVSIT